MLVPILALVVVLLAILIGAIYKAKKGVEARTDDDHHGHHHHA